MTVENVKQALLNSIKTLTMGKWMFSRAPKRDNTRNRKIPFEKVVSAILAFRGGTLNAELMDFFDLDCAVPTSSAFIQQRAKIIPEAFEILFHHFTDHICENRTYKGYRLFAVDGSDLQIAANSQDTDSFYPGANGQKPYSLLHINAMYDLLQHIYRQHGKYYIQHGLCYLIHSEWVDSCFVSVLSGQLYRSTGSSCSLFFFIFCHTSL